MIGDTSTWLECNKAMLEYIHPQYLRDEIDVSLNFKSCNEIRSHYVIGTCICKTGLMQYFMFIWLKTLMVKYMQQCAKNHDIPDVCCVTSIVQEFICPKNICPILMSFNLIAYITCCKSNKSVCKTGKLNGSNSLKKHIFCLHV